MDIKFVSSVAVITPDSAESRKLYVEALGLPLQAPPGDEYMFSDAIQGSKHFGLWPLHQAAEACFGASTWPADRRVPQASIEFDVASEAEVAAAASELEGRGYTMLHPARTEPWGQVVARLQTPEGVILGISFIPSMH